MNGGSGEINKCEVEHFKYIRDLGFTSDYSKIIIASDDYQLSVYDLNEQKTVNVMSGHYKVINSLSINPKDGTIASCSADKTLKIWDLRSKSPLDTITSGNQSN